MSTTISIDGASSFVNGVTPLNDVNLNAMLSGLRATTATANAAHSIANSATAATTTAQSIANSATTAANRAQSSANNAQGAADAAQQAVKETKGELAYVKNMLQGVLSSVQLLNGESSENKKFINRIMRVIIAKLSTPSTNAEVYALNKTNQQIFNLNITNFEKIVFGKAILGGL